MFHVLTTMGVDVYPGAYVDYGVGDAELWRPFFTNEPAAVRCASATVSLS